jgi:uncharacterized membrane protein YbhN (UPF0104 family)
MRWRRALPVGIAVATIGSFALLVRQASHGALHVAANPSWPLLGVAFGVSIAVQLLRALAWSRTLREPLSFRAVFAASSIGSFLDTVLPARLGEASKVGVLRVATGPEWPGVGRAGGSLACAHAVEAMTFSLVGAVAALFLPLPGWTRKALVLGFLGAGLALAVAIVLNRQVGHRLPQVLRSFLASAGAPAGTIAGAGAILLATWAMRCLGAFLVLHAIGIHVGIGGALVFMVLTGLANTMPLLPGNVGLYQGAAIAALALLGHAGQRAVAASLVAPVFGTVATAAAALIAMSLFGRRFAELGRAAWVRS